MASKLLAVVATALCVLVLVLTTDAIPQLRKHFPQQQARWGVSSPLRTMLRGYDEKTGRGVSASFEEKRSSKDRYNLNKACDKFRHSNSALLSRDVGTSPSVEEMLCVFGGNTGSGSSVVHETSDYNYYPHWKTDGGSSPDLVDMFSTIGGKTGIGGSFAFEESPSDVSKDIQIYDPCIVPDLSGTSPSLTKMLCQFGGRTGSGGSVMFTDKIQKNKVRF